MCFGMAAVVTALDETAHLGCAAEADCVDDFGFVGGVALGRQPLSDRLKDFLNFKGHGNHLRSCRPDSLPLGDACGTDVYKDL